MIPLRVMGPQNDANAGGTPFSAVADCDDLSALEWDDAFSEISPSIQPRQRKSVPPPVIDSDVSRPIAKENVHWRKISSKKFSCIINECGHTQKTFTSKASALQHLSSYHKIGDTSKTCRCGYTTQFKSNQNSPATNAK